MALASKIAVSLSMSSVAALSRSGGPDVSAAGSVAVATRKQWLPNLWDQSVSVVLPLARAASEAALAAASAVEEVVAAVSGADSATVAEVGSEEATEAAIVEEAIEGAEEDVVALGISRTAMVPDALPRVLQLDLGDRATAAEMVGMGVVEEEEAATMTREAAAGTKTEIESRGTAGAAEAAGSTTGSDRTMAEEDTMTRGASEGTEDPTNKAIRLSRVPLRFQPVLHSPTTVYAWVRHRSL